MATTATTRTGALTFEQKMTWGMSAFILFGFGQFAARGLVDYSHIPLIFHLHGALMVTWLALLSTQTALEGRGNLALHRRLGWLSVILVPAVVVVGSVTCAAALRLGLQPPFFTPAYFLALVHVGVITFGALVATAIARRSDTAWHKRLILGSTIVLLEPALGRVLPMPLMIGWSEWAVLAIQLGMAGLMMRHDRRVTGAIHPATQTVVLALVLSHVLIETLARVPAWQHLAAQVAAG